MTFIVKTLEGICCIVYVYVTILVMFLWFFYLPGFECCEQIQSENFELRKVLEVQELFSNLLGETHWNVALHIRKPWRYPKVSSP